MAWSWPGGCPRPGGGPRLYVLIRTLSSSCTRSLWCTRSRQNQIRSKYALRFVLKSSWPGRSIPCIFQFAPLVYSAKEGKRDIILVPDDVPTVQPWGDIDVESLYIQRWRINRSSWLGNITVNRRAFNVEKSTNTVGEASMWNRPIFDVDESTLLVDRKISSLSRRWIDVKNILRLHR